MLLRMRLATVWIRLIPKITLLDVIRCYLVVQTVNPLLECTWLFQAFMPRRPETQLQGANEFFADQHDEVFQFALDGIGVVVSIQTKHLHNARFLLGVDGMQGVYLGFQFVDSADYGSKFHSKCSSASKLSLELHRAQYQHRRPAVWA